MSKKLIENKILTAATMPMAHKNQTQTLLSIAENCSNCHGKVKFITDSFSSCLVPYLFRPRLLSFSCRKKNFIII